MSYDYWNFVGNTNLITNREFTIQNVCWRYLGIWVWLTAWWMMIAGLALNKRSSSSKVKQTLQRKSRNSLFVKATQRSKSVCRWIQPQEQDPTSSRFSKESLWSSHVIATRWLKTLIPLCSQQQRLRQQSPVQHSEGSGPPCPVCQANCKISVQDWYKEHFIVCTQQILCRVLQSRQREQ